MTTSSRTGGDHPGTEAPPIVMPFAPDTALIEARYPAFLDAARKALDWDELERIAERHKNSGSEKKYLDTERWLRRKYAAAIFLNLHDCRPLDILDIGTGAGHFPFIAKSLGHSVRAIDLPGIPLYDDLCAWMGIEKQPFKVEARRPLPDLGQRFDLITAFMIGFNTKADGTLFTLDDWAYFLDDVREHRLKPGGHLLLKMIRQQDRSGPKFRDPALMALFESRGARLYSGSHALFQPLR